jgi:hypothetical protein
VSCAEYPRFSLGLPRVTSIKLQSGNHVCPSLCHCVIPSTYKAPLELPVGNTLSPNLGSTTARPHCGWQSGWMLEASQGPLALVGALGHVAHLTLSRKTAASDMCHNRNGHTWLGPLRGQVVVVLPTHSCHCGICLCASINMRETTTLGQFQWGQYRP